MVVSVNERQREREKGWGEAQEIVFCKVQVRNSISQSLK